MQATRAHLHQPAGVRVADEQQVVLARGHHSLRVGVCQLHGADAALAHWLRFLQLLQCTSHGRHTSSVQRRRRAAAAIAGSRVCGAAGGVCSCRSG
jgi:hypothetical protein